MPVRNRWPRPRIGGWLLFGVFIQFAVASSLQAGDWLSWRGPTGNGVAEPGQRLPLRWSASENVVWKAPIPGRGHSSPIVVGQRVLLTTADEATQLQLVLCLDRRSGRLLWRQVVQRGPFNPKIHAKNTHATPTVASDGKQVYVVFQNEAGVQLSALNLDGKLLWERRAGDYQPQKYQFGYAPSPVLFEDRVIVASEFETGGFLAAFSSRDGQEVWRTPRQGFNSYSSPIVGRVAGREQLLISGGNRVAGYDPRNGKLLWDTPGTTMATCGTMVWDETLVFASGGYPERETLAVKADGSSEVVWRNQEKCYEQSMLVHAGHLYAINDNGIAFCWDARTGTQRWRARLAGPISASPILADDRIYASNERGTTFVFRASPSGFEQLAENQLGSEAFASPTICGDRIFLRVASGSGSQRQETLYCLGLTR